MSVRGNPRGRYHHLITYPIGEFLVDFVAAKSPDLGTISSLVMTLCFSDVG